MALKKSQLYSSLWQSCDELRGGMDASQYKDYVLTLLFVKYVSDKHASDRDSLINVPEGASFADMVRLKGDKEIGDRINKQIIGRIAEANDLKGVIDQADFNDDTKLGSGKEMQDRLSRLVAIFDKLDFRANRAEGDDLLGDAYEYLMRHFATESGKSKGQFYTPAEVSRIMAQVIGIERAGELREPTVYDPTCGSGSLLIKAAGEAGTRNIAIFGQEMDNATWALARMNMILHGHPTAELWKGNTLAAPYFRNNYGNIRSSFFRDGDGNALGSESNSYHGGLKTFDFAVANPPFSAKSWTSGLDPANDEFGRFEYGIPPAKNGDYAFLLHLIKSLKSTGKGAIILPHGVLFRGNKEADIRRELIRRGLIKGIIGLPANLFYGTGIPACILVVDKEHAASRRGLFMIDASRGFIKDGNKNRLRSQDIHKIVDVFNHQIELPGYSRMVPVSEIANEANGYNLNLPRYIDAAEPEDLHDLHAHLNGGIPNRDLDALEAYWQVFPALRQTLFSPLPEEEGPGVRAGYSEARVDTHAVKATILAHPEFTAYADQVRHRTHDWQQAHAERLKNLAINDLPRDVIHALSEDLLERFAEIPLLDRYDVYQRLMDYWHDTMQDDVYLIAADSWLEAGRNLHEAYDKETPDLTIKKGKKSLKYVGDLVPASLLIARFFNQEQLELERLEGEVSESSERKEEFEAEHAGDEGALSGLEGKSGITKGNVQDRAMALKGSVLKSFRKGTTEHEQAKAIKKTMFGTKPWNKGVRDGEGLFEELDVLYDYLQILDEESTRKSAHKETSRALHKSVIEKYPNLTESEIRILVVEDKWFASLHGAIEMEVQRLTQQLAGRVKELEERYARPLPALENEVEAFSARVEAHLKKMGLAWG